MGKSRFRLIIVKAATTLVMVVFIGGAVAGEAFVFSRVLEGHTAPSVEAPRPESAAQADAKVRDSGPAASLPSTPEAVSSTASALPSEIEDAWALILVNSENPIPKDYENVTVEAEGVQVDSRIAEPLRQLFAAAKADGMNLYTSSGYRSRDKQEKLFDKAVQDNLDKGMEQSAAEAVAADSINPPGCSEHNTGLAVDLNGVKDEFCDTKEYRWLMEHAAQYGFVLRYPKDKQEITNIMYEPWHFRYVGPANAAKMQAENLCLEEYVEQIG